VQCSALFGDDATLDQLGAQLACGASDSGLGLVLLRAGAAPWHDDLTVLQRLAQRLPAGAVRVADSLELWELCALLAGSAAVIASSLHGRIVASAFARPCISLQPVAAAQRIVKLDAWVQTWEPERAGSVVAPDGLAGALARALREPQAARAATARQLAGACRTGYAALLASLA
jgi:hypothetical protein